MRTWADATERTSVVTTAIANSDRTLEECIVLYFMIRPAVPGDVELAIPLILLAIDDIAFLLSGTTDVGETKSILSDFFRQPENRLSYENCLLMEENGEVVGIAILYDGADAVNLNSPVEQAAAKKTGNADYLIPIEPEESAFYLDAIGVNPSCHGPGFGTALIEAASAHARKLGHTRFALLVETENSAAKRLYDRLGFHSDGTKWIAGKEYYHMVRQLGTV